jgi:hypothetical protein
MSVLSNETEISPGVSLFVKATPAIGTAVASNLNITPFPGTVQSSVSSSQSAPGTIVYYKGTAGGSAGVGITQNNIAITTLPSAPGGTQLTGNYTIPLTNPPTFNAGSGSSNVLTRTTVGPSGGVGSGQSYALPVPVSAGLYLYVMTSSAANTDVPSKASQISTYAYFNGTTFQTGGAISTPNGAGSVDIGPNADRTALLFANNLTGNSLAGMGVYVIPVMGNIGLA